MENDADLYIMRNGELNTKTIKHLQCETHGDFMRPNFLAGFKNTKWDALSEFLNVDKMPIYRWFTLGT